MEFSTELTPLSEALKQTTIATVGPINIVSKNIILIYGPSNVGKTALSLHFANNCAINDRKVLYVDKDKNPITSRIEPNLLSFFFHNNPLKISKYLKIITPSKTEEIYSEIDSFNPRLIIIDSIYTIAMESASDPPMKRAKRVQEIVKELYPKILSLDAAAIITTPTGKTTGYCSGGKVKPKYDCFGGEGLKRLCSSKWEMSRMEQEQNKYKCKIDIDLQETHVILFEYGGSISKII